MTTIRGFACPWVSRHAPRRSRALTTQVPTLEEWPPPVDGRLGLAVQPQPTDSWSLSLWCLEDGAELVLLYACALARPETERKWSTADVLKEGGKARLRRVTLTATYGTVTAILGALCHGSTLRMAAEDASVPIEGDAAYAGLRLSIGGREVVECYAPTPWFFAPIADDFGVRSAELRFRSSPNPEAPAIATSLLVRDKSALASNVAFAPSGRFERVLGALERDTGLPFSTEGAARLGDIDLFLFPAAFPTERPRVGLAFDSRRVVVTLRDLPAGMEAIVRCGQEAGTLLLADEALRVVATATAVVQFETAPDGPHVTTVEVWVGTSGRPLGLWFRHTLGPIRQVHSTMHLVTGEDRLDSTWLWRWAADRKKRDSVDALRRVQRAYMHTSSVMGDANAPFVDAAHGGRAWARDVRPTPSGSKLFAIGERVEFAVWLRDELGRTDGISRVVLIDPFFDAWGVEMFARVQDTRCSFEVVTALFRAGGEAPTRTALEEACARLDLMLRHVQLTITGLLGDPRPIHDRLLLAFDGDQPVRGYHLSNSLSGAASQHALLVTVIGADVLAAVADSAAREIPDDANRRVTIRANHRVLTPAVDPDDAEPPASLEELSAAVLAEENEEVRAEAWSTFARKLACTHGSEPVLTDFAQHARPDFLAWLAAWIRSLAERPLTGVLQREDVAILTPYTSTFARVAGDAAHYLRFHHSSGGSTWGVRYGMELLASAAPTTFVSMVDAIVRMTPPSDVPFEARAPVGALLVEATICIVNPFARGRQHDRPFLTALLESQTAFVRAVCAAMLGAAVLRVGGREPMATAEALSLLEQSSALALDEKLMAVAEWIGDLRVRANRNNHVEDDASRELRRALMAELVEWWPEAGRHELLADVVHRLEGPMPGGWAEDTTNDFLCLLETAQKQTSAATRRVWLELLASRLPGQRAGRTYFSARSDGPLTAIAAQAVARGGIVAEVEPFAAALKRARRRVLRPFARSPYDEWADARDSILWIELFGRLVAEAAVSGSAIEGRAAELVAGAADVGSYLETDVDDSSGLIAMVRAVRDHVRGQHERED